MNSYLMMQEMRRLIEKMDPQNPKEALQVFSHTVQTIKFFAQRKGIYSYKMGYLNGIAIMIMVAYVMGPIYINRNAECSAQKLT